MSPPSRLFGFSQRRQQTASTLGNLPGCVNPPAIEEECRAFAEDRSYAEYQLHDANVGEIREDAQTEIRAIRDEAYRDAKAIVATAIVGAKALFSSCVIAANALPYPASTTATAKCIGWYALKMAGIIANLNRQIAAADDRWAESYDLVDAEQHARNSNIELQRSKSLKRENVRNQFQTSLIASDLEHCIWRVNND